MHIHILGICGTFMGSLALLAKALGHKVTGSDASVYPPMSTQLAEQGIEIMTGYLPEHLQPAPDLVVVGNAMSRGNPAVEYLLDTGLPYISGPQWLSEHLLKERWVLAVAGTHGKTTTASMLAWILEYAGMSPGYLIGGIPGNFALSARLGDTPFFVIEADEYDTAFFDKRSKFVHYRPRTLVMNNLEFDHADIFPDLAAIQRQFHHLVRIVPGSGQLITAAGCKPLEEVLAMGAWTPVVRAGIEQGEWQARPLKADGSVFAIYEQGRLQGEVSWQLTGQHNVANGLMALLAARHVGVTLEHGTAALCAFAGVKRRMEKLGQVGKITLYDDFAHHPTAIATTLQGLRAQVGDEQIVAIIEPRSNTMRLGEHRNQLASAASPADRVIWYQPEEMNWSLQETLAGAPGQEVFSSVEAIIDTITATAGQLAASTHVVIMSNGGFEAIHTRLLSALQQVSVQESFQ